MRRFNEKLNALTHSTHSSILDQGLATSQFAGLSQIHDNVSQENGLPRVTRASLALSPERRVIKQGQPFISNDPASRARQHYFTKRKVRPSAASPVKSLEIHAARQRSAPRASLMVPYHPQPLEEKLDFEVNPFDTEKPISNFKRSVIESLNTTAQIAEMAKASFLSSGVTSQASEAAPSEYRLTLRVKYETKFGEQIAVVGNLPQLGSWNVKKALIMKWTPGHVWEVEGLKITDKPYFMYKYILLWHGRHKKWEQGLDRIADLSLLPEQQAPDDASKVLYQEAPTWQAPKIKRVLLQDEWETYTANFQVFDPERDPETVMRIAGEREELGQWHSKGGPQEMSLSKHRSKWLQSRKYGQKVQIYNQKFKFKNAQWSMPIVFRYNYSKRPGSADRSTDWEREPCRNVEIGNPNEYEGQSSIQPNCQKVWIVNGELTKCDANFKANFTIREIEGAGLFISNQPLIEDDIRKIANHRVTAVLNLTNDLGDLNYMKELYARHGIFTVATFPIEEFSKLPMLCDRLFQGCLILDELFKSHKKVLVHCSRGITRAPSLAIAYLSLTCRVICWQSPVDTYRLVKRSLPSAFPNMRGVIRMLKEQRDFQFERNLAEQEKREQYLREQEERRQKLLIRAREDQQKLENFMEVILNRREKRRQDRLLRLEQQFQTRVRVYKETIIESHKSSMIGTGSDIVEYRVTTPPNEQDEVEPQPVLIEPYGDGGELDTGFIDITAEEEEHIRLQILKEEEQRELRSKALIKEAEYEARIRYHQEQLSNLIGENRKQPSSFASSRTESLKQGQVQIVDYFSERSRSERAQDEALRKSAAASLKDESGSSQDETEFEVPDEHSSLESQGLPISSQANRASDQPTMERLQDVELRKTAEQILQESIQNSHIPDTLISMPTSQNNLILPDEDLQELQDDQQTSNPFSYGGSSEQRPSQVQQYGVAYQEQEYYEDQEQASGVYYESPHHQYHPSRLTGLGSIAELDQEQSQLAGSELTGDYSQNRETTERRSLGDQPKLSDFEDQITIKNYESQVSHATPEARVTESDRKTQIVPDNTKGWYEGSRIIVASPFKGSSSKKQLTNPSSSPLVSSAKASPSKPHDLLEKNQLSSEKKLKCTAVTSTNNPYLSVKQSGLNQVSDLSNLNSLLQSRHSDNQGLRKQSSKRSSEVMVPLLDNQFNLPADDRDEQQELLFNMIQKRKLQIDMESVKKSFSSRLKEQESSPQMQFDEGPPSAEIAKVIKTSIVHMEELKESLKQEGTSLPPFTPVEEPTTPIQLHQVQEETEEQSFDNSAFAEGSSERTMPALDQDEEYEELYLTEEIETDLQQAGLSREELAQRRKELFGKTAPPPLPIDFAGPPSSDSIKLLSLKILQLASLFQVKFPIIHIHGSTYLVGIHRCLCEQRGATVMIRVGGGYQTLSSYISKNRAYFECMLVIMMAKSGDTLEQVIWNLIQGATVKSTSHSPVKEQTHSPMKSYISMASLASRSKKKMTKKDSIASISSKGSINNMTESSSKPLFFNITKPQIFSRASKQTESIKHLVMSKEQLPSGTGGGSKAMFGKNSMKSFRASQNKDKTLEGRSLRKSFTNKQFIVPPQPASPFRIAPPAKLHESSGEDKFKSSSNKSGQTKNFGSTTQLSQPQLSVQMSEPTVDPPLRLPSKIPRIAPSTSGKDLLAQEISKGLKSERSSALTSRVSSTTQLKRLSVIQKEQKIPVRKLTESTLTTKKHNFKP